MTGLILSSNLLLSACGQKGPLYLPEKKSVTPVAPLTPANSTNAKAADSSQK
ncbi:LPS translocon maturation chaperone LptM [Undibacterium sp. Di24W]|uniref:LPS translocon maturation chaperone LptM n=1 Tax=Undibacterium sp. Di24W TaxID=3413033 RepID=UPI003BF17714